MFDELGRKRGSGFYAIPLTDIRKLGGNEIAVRVYLRAFADTIRDFQEDGDWDALAKMFEVMKAERREGMPLYAACRTALHEAMGV